MSHKWVLLSSKFLKEINYSVSRFFSAPRNFSYFALPIKLFPQVNIAWESETVSNIATVTGGSGRYTVEAPKGSTGTADGGKLTAVVPGPGSYDLVIADQCVSGDRQHVEVRLYA